MLIFFLRNKVEIIVDRHFKYNKVSYLKKFLALILITIFTINYNFGFLKLFIMLQRIQTIYILLFCVVIFLAAFCPFASVVYLNDSTYFLYPTGWQSQSSLEGFNNYPFFTSYLVSISFAILMLVNYKKRSKQLRYGKICYFFVLLSVVIMFLEL